MERAPRHKFINKLKALNLRPEHIAITLNRSATSVYRWKSGESVPKLTPKELVTFCEFLDVSMYELAELFESEDT